MAKSRPLRQLKYFKIYSVVLDGKFPQEVDSTIVVTDVKGTHKDAALLSGFPIKHGESFVRVERITRWRGTWDRMDTRQISRDQYNHIQERLI